MSDQQPITYNGWWERAGRTPAAAATLALLGIGVLYFIAQNVLAFIAMGISAAVNGIPLSKGEDMLSNMSAMMKDFALPIQIALILSQFLFMLVPVLWVVRRWHTTDVRRYIRLKSTSPVQIILAVIATVAVIPTGEFIVSLLTKNLGMSDELMKMSTELFTAHSLPEFLWLVLVIAVTPAICEEIMFRGYMQRTFERSIGWKSVWLAGVIFGLYHFQPLGLATLALIGIMLGYFYYRSKSLFPGMAAHFANNFLAVYMLYNPPKLFGIDFAKADEIPLSWVLATLPVAVIALFLFHRSTRKNMESEEQNAEMRAEPIEDLSKTVHPQG